MAPSRPASCDAWTLLVRLFFSQRSHLPPLAADLDLSPAQCHVLHAIEPGQPMPMGRLAERLACDASNVTGLTNRLEARGLLRRRPSAGDRRVKVLVLTAAGVRLRRQLVARITSPPEQLGRLTPQEQRLLVEMLARLLE